MASTGFPRVEPPPAVPFGSLLCPSKRPASVAHRHARATAAVSAQGVAKVYGEGDTRVVALDGVDVDFAAGGYTAIMGPSGSGKSTLMHCLAGLDSVTEGKVQIGDTEITELDDKGLTLLRRERIGFVFQAFNLVPTLTALENITLPMDIAGRKPDKEWLDRVIDTIGLRDRLGHRPTELSGGQQQRVACARALAVPTGRDLRRRADRQPRLPRRDRDPRVPPPQRRQDYGQTIVMVTHDPMAASYADRVLFLADGRIVDEMVDPTAELVLERMKRFDSAGRTS